MLSRPTSCARLRHVLLLCLIPVTLAAQQTHVSGTVRDQSGAAIVSARVTIHSAHKTETVQTDSAGKFDFTDVTDLTGTVAVTATSFESATENWSLTHPGIDFALHPTSESE